MPLTDPILWAHINDHFTPPDSGDRTFAEQLRREHRITTATADAAIREYRRFIYLVALNQGRTVPPEVVDEVWHLHMSHSYWHKLCADRPTHSPCTGNTRRTWRRFLPNVAAIPRGIRG